jgi:putative membrane protein
MNPTLRSILAGSASGFVATIPMSAVMLAALPFFPRSQRRLPPKEITWNLAKAVGLEDVLRHPDRARSHVITTAGHFGYGAVAGALYPRLARRLPGAPVAKGAAFGLLVWAASYLGWLPAADVRHSSLRDAPSRNAVMILAHLVWGGTLGCVSGRAEQLMSRARTGAVGGRARARRPGRARAGSGNTPLAR